MELKGKAIAFLGDSITEGIGVIDRENNRYDNILMKECSLRAVYNYGISGTRLAHQSVPTAEPRKDLCFAGRAYDLNPDADIIVVYGGINDYFSGDAPIGSKEDRTPATFYGAVWFIMDLLRTRYPGKTVVFMSPAKCSYDGIDMRFPSTRAIKKPDALPVEGYVRIIKEVSEEFDIPVLDLYRCLPIDPNNPEQKEKYTADGLHFNDVGQHILATTLREFLEAL